jgi:hypothetical protein
MPFVELDPEIVWKALEGYHTELEPEQKKLDAFYRQFSCPRCKGTCQKELDSRHAFSDPNTIVPRALLRCTGCRHLFDPHTGIDLELGNPFKIPPTIPIVGIK